jgi:hypothetical protein
MATNLDPGLECGHFGWRDCDGYLCGTGPFVQGNQAQSKSHRASQQRGPPSRRGRGIVNRRTLSGRTIVPQLGGGNANEIVSVEDQALQWLLYQDPLSLDPNSVTDQERLLQRYALRNGFARHPSRLVSHINRTQHFGHLLSQTNRHSTRVDWSLDGLGAALDDWQLFD